MNPRVQIALLLAAAAGAAKNAHRRLGRVSETPSHRIQRLEILPNEAIAAHAANYVTIIVTNVTRGKEIGRWSTVTGGAANTGALVVGTPVVPVLGDDLLFSPGDIIKAALTHAGAGAVVDVAVEVHAVETQG